MTTTDVALIEAQVQALDHTTALRVTRLVLECGSSLAMALMAVQEADRESMAHAKGAAALLRGRWRISDVFGTHWSPR